MAASGGDANLELDHEPKAGAGSSAGADVKPQWFRSLVSGWQQVLGGESCIGSRRKQEQKQCQKQSGQLKVRVHRGSPLGKRGFECCWDRADLAGFLGVPDKESAVKDMLFTHVSQLIYAAGQEMCAVSLPFVNQAAQGNVTTYGWLRSAQSLVSVGGTIAFGRFADVYGTRAAMVVAHSAAFAYSAIIAVASSQELLFVTIVPCAILHGFQAAQLVAATRSAPETRGQALGQVTLSYGLGFVTGSVVLVASGNHLHPRAAAAIAAGVEAIFVVTMLRCDVLDDALSIVHGVQDPLITMNNTDAVGGTHISAALPQSVAARLLRLFSVAGVPQILFVKFGIISASGLVLNMVPQFALDPFGVGTTQSALLMAYTSLVQMATQVGAGRYLDIFDDTLACSDTWEYDSPYNRMPASLKVVVLGGGTIALSLLAIVLPEILGRSFDVLCLPLPWTIEGPWTAALASARPVVSWRAFAFWIGPLAAAQQVVLNAMSTELTKRAPHQDLGLVLGVDMAMFSGTGVATPLAAAWLMQHYGFSAVPLAGASLASATVGSMMLIGSSLETRSGTDKQDSKPAAVYCRAPAAPRAAYRKAGQRCREKGSELKVPAVAAIMVTDDQLGP